MNSRRITVEKEYGELPEIYCYPGELNQVFMNVIVNAVQAIEGRGTVRLQSDLDQDHVIVRIADTGRGISKERLETIFDPAFSNKDARVGMGLGLAMSYNIIRKHHGRIDLESTPDEGTEVTIRLPVRPV